MAEQKKYYIRVQGRMIEVSRETYKVYHSTERHSRTLDEKDMRNGRILYSALDTKELLGEEMLEDKKTPSVEDIVFSHLLHERLHQCLELLPKMERDLIYALFFEKQSERQLARQNSLPYMTIHNRKVRVLKKLKKMLENEK